MEIKKLVDPWIDLPILEKTGKEYPYVFTCRHSNENQINGNYHVSMEYFVVQNPTSNCQLFCIANFEDFFKLSPQQFKLHLNRICILMCKYLALIDIHTRLVPELKSKIADMGIEIVFETPYTSTNASKMSILMLRFPPEYLMYPENQLNKHT